MFAVACDVMVGEFSSNHPLGVENRIFRIDRQLIFRRVPDQSLTVTSKRHVARRDSVSLVVGDYFNSAVFEHTHTKKNFTSCY